MTVVKTPKGREERLEKAMFTLKTALTDYDVAKAEHKETTDTLTEAKKKVDECARHLVTLKFDPQADLFDDSAE